jgi:ABC-type transport system involved in cytochrome bd biosynthesis fused ATPase/permease subunit
MGTPRAFASYTQPNAKTRVIGKPKREELRTGTMREATDVLRIVGIILLGIFVLAVGIPLVLTAAGIALGIVGILFSIAVGVIKLAIVLAVCYLILVGIRAVLR